MKTFKPHSNDLKGLEDSPWETPPSRSALPGSGTERRNGWLGRLLYGTLFVLVLPLCLWAWARGAGVNISLPAIHNSSLGIAMGVVGGALLVWGMLSLWVYGHGLPMNPYPPPRYVSRGAYGLMQHPIYVGFSLLCVGAAIGFGSAAGLWLVCPVVMMSCAALVFGYENIDLHDRFGESLPKPWLRIPSDANTAPDIAERMSIYFLVLLPWAGLYELLAASGVPADAVSGFLPFERKLPVLEWTEALYAGTYLLVTLVPWVAGTRHVLREFAVQGFIATCLMILFFSTIPVVAVPRAFAPHSLLGELLNQERRFDTPANALPSYHVFWILLSMTVFADRFPRWRYTWWLLGAAMCLSCVTTGMHAVIDVAGGVALFLATRCYRWFWEFLRRAAEQIANSWREWQFGRVRVINHGLYAGIGAALAIAIVGFLLGSDNAVPILFVGLVALVTSALWAQFVEGCPSLLRPYGYYGGMLGIILGSVLAGPLFGINPWLLLAAYSVAGPWVQSFGRLRCLVQGCCHGREAPVSLGIIYRHPRSRVCRLATLQGVPVHPTPLYSILWNVVIAALMARLWFVHAPLAIIGGLYLILTGVGRFVEEAYRGEPQTRWIGGLRLYQWIAIVTVVAGAVVTCVPTPHAAGSLHWILMTLLLAVGFGILTWFALGVDFPASKRRFARLA